MMRKSRFYKLLCVSLAALLLLAALTGCERAVVEVEDPVLECEEGAISLSFYEFLLSRMKGTLARNKYEVKDPAFWATEIEGMGETYESYYNAAILENCKNYLAASVLFDREKLSLNQATLDAIDEEVNFYIDYDGQKSEEKFNALIEKYGVDADSLREAYILEAKYELLLSYLYGGGSLIAGSVKEEFYRENYVRFKQIMFPSFYYEYERDEQGNIIYFDTETGEPLYDTDGVYIYDETGNRVKDKYGNTIYYNTDGKIVYDTEKGQPSVVVDETGVGVQHFFSAEELAERKRQATELAASLEKGNTSAFEAEKKKYVNIEGDEDAYPDGYYLSNLEKSGYEDYMLEILALLTEMEEGEIRMLETEYGCHVIMKYGLDAGKYAEGAYAEWFGGFNDALITKLFLDKCATVLHEITVNEENLAKARSIKQIGTNYDY